MPDATSTKNGRTGTRSSDDGTVAIRVRGVVNRFGRQVVHDGLDLDVRRGEVMGFVGRSGGGKSVLLRTLVGLREPDAGSIEVLGQPVHYLHSRDRRLLSRRWGVLFQDGALFSTLTVAQNIQVPMREHLRFAAPLMDELAALKIALAGLPADAGEKLPSELSGGMRKRAGLARALALDPGDPLSRRAHRRPRPDCGFQLRQPYRRFEAKPWPHGIPRYPRSRHAPCGLRPGLRPDRSEGRDRDD